LIEKNKFEKLFDTKD